MKMSFIHACRQGDLDTVKQLVENGHNPSEDDNEGLLVAIEGCHYDVITYLITLESVYEHYTYSDYLLTANMNDLTVWTILCDAEIEFESFGLSYFLSEVDNEEVRRFIRNLQ